MAASDATDYLVVGAGLTGLAFADTLVAEDAEAEVTLLDRRPAPGGHWLDAYPFIRLHSPSAYYGVNSLSLGSDRIDRTGENAGFYERATGEEVRDYLAEVASRLVRTGRVRILAEHEHGQSGSAGERVRDLRTGRTGEIAVRRRVVDARYQEASVPATHVPPFEVAAGAQMVPVGELPDAAGSAERYTVLGSGKTAVDACNWLLLNGTDPERIRWARPRDAWFHDRRQMQPLDGVGPSFEGISHDAEAGALATDLDDLVARLEQAGRLLRIDPSQPATMYRGAYLSAAEVDAARRIEDVIRLGRVRRIEPDRLVFEQGEATAGPGTLHVDCTAIGISDAPATPIFAPGRIVCQQVRYNQPAFNAALLAFVEAHRDDDAERNRLCPPNPYASSIGDWPRMIGSTFETQHAWASEPDLAGWISRSRLNLFAALPDHADEPVVQAALERYAAHVGAAVENLKELADPQAGVVRS